MSISIQHLEELRKVYLFEHLNDAQLKQVADHARLLHLSAGDMLFAEGDACHHFYFVCHGMMKLYKGSPDGAERVLELVAAKQLFAEDAMFVGEFSVQAGAVEASELIAFDSASFAGLLRSDTDLCLRMMTLMSHRSKSMIDEIGNLTLQSAIQRAVRFLIDMGSDSASIVHLGFSKGLIASRLGVTPETFSRIITRLRNEGMIECAKNLITLKKVDSLQQVADGVIGLKL